MRSVRSVTYENEALGLWRVAAVTVVRTVLAFALPYFVAYYSVVGAWQGFHTVMLWMRGAR
jgi:hypothetical protein